MLRYFTKRQRPISFVFGFLALVAVIFQNCGKAGFDGTDEQTTTTNLSSMGDQRLSGVEFPYDYNLNLISYMSCPAASKKNIPTSDPLTPYYNLRFGAYDNTAYAADFGIVPGGALETERLKGGLKIREKFFSDVQAEYKRNDSEIMKRSLMNHPAIQGVIPAAALLNGNGSRDTQLGYHIFLFSPFLDTLSNGTMAEYLSNAPKNPGYGTVRKEMFSALSSDRRAIVGSMAFGESPKDRDLLLNKLRTDLFLQAGYADQSALDISQMKSPTGNLKKSVYGRSYKLSFTQEANGLTAPRSMMVNKVTPYSMEAEGPAVLASSEAWECFSMRVVRHMDRLDFISKKPMYQCREPTSLSVPAFPLKDPMYKICDYWKDNGTPAGVVINGVRTVCPPQTVASLNPSEVGISAAEAEKRRVARLRLNMARRVLPAEYWELNTNSDYMCAVPTKAAMDLGSCYASKDDDSTKYIQYDLNMAGKLECDGPGGNECPAYVSVCYRK